MDHVAAILLAAGASRRLGQPKQLLCWNGRPLIIHCLETLQAAGCDSITVVLGAHAQPIQATCEETFQNSNIVFGHCPRWEQGQATSLAFGRELIESYSSRAHVLVTLCDQPLLTPSDYRQLINAVRDEQFKVAATEYPEGGGAPACFHQQSHWLISHPTTDIGAKHWIRAQASAECKLFPFGHRIEDVDTVQQWNRLSESD